MMQSLRNIANRKVCYVFTLSALLAPPALAQSVVSTLPVPGISSAVTYSFDLGAVDRKTDMYYVTDRTNKSIDVIDLKKKNKVVTQFINPEFAGCNSAAFVPIPTCNGASNDNSGPDGIDVVGPNLYVGDVNALWIMDKTTGATVKKIAIPSTPDHLRADEGCFDRDDHIYGISTPGAAHPFMTFVDTVTQTVIATVVMDDTTGANSAGLEACVYDRDTKMFFVNNDGSTANPRGEVDGFAAAAIVALKTTAPSTVQLTSLAPVIYPLGNCDPTGIALGGHDDLGIMCRQGNVGELLTFVILNKKTGAQLASLNIGGGDQVAYDFVSHRWFLSNSRWTATGMSCGGGSVACPLTPVMGVVDGRTRTVIAKVANGNNAHSVAVDGERGLVMTPFNHPTATGGGAAFPNGGINLFSTRTLGPCDDDWPGSAHGQGASNAAGCGMDSPFRWK